MLFLRALCFMDSHVCVLPFSVGLAMFVCAHTCLAVLTLAAMVFWWISRPLTRTWGDGWGDNRGDAMRKVQVWKIRVDVMKGGTGGTGSMSVTVPVRWGGGRGARWCDRCDYRQVWKKGAHSCGRRGLVSWFVIKENGRMTNSEQGSALLMIISIFIRFCNFYRLAV